MKYLLSKFLGVALMSTLAIGSVSPISTAQAAPAGVSAYFSMRVRNPKTTLRCGQTVTYHVVVEAEPSNGMPTPGPSQLGIPRGISVVGVYVEADSTDKSVGDFVGAGRVRTTVSLDSELSTLTAAKFRFKAGKPGKTTLYFDGLVGTEHAAVQLDVKVLPCRFKLNSVSVFRVGMTSVGTMDGEIEADEQGNFTGSATVNWVTSMLCGISSPIAPGKADMAGTINESGQLVGEIMFGPITSVGGGPCGTVSVTTSNFGILDPLTIRASSEGVSVYTQPQAINATNGSFTGTATIVVIPEEEEGVAFNPNSRAALSPSSWWTKLRGNHPWLYDTLLALH